MPVLGLALDGILFAAAADTDDFDQLLSIVKVDAPYRCWSLAGGPSSPPKTGHPHPQNKPSLSLCWQWMSTFKFLPIIVMASGPNAVVILLS